MNIYIYFFYIRLILVDANHCPGAVCIIFTFENGKRVLHTGDFRWDNSLLERFRTYNNIAKNPSNLRNLTVYLDTTYCDPSHNFAKQEAVISEILENAISHLTAAKSFVEGTADSAFEDSVKFSVLFLVGAYAIGKERVYMSLSQKLGLKVHVEKSRLQALLCLDWPIEDHARLISSAVTPEIVKGLPPGSIPAKAAILVVNMNQLNFDSIRHIEKTKTKHKFSKIVAYQPTGWTHTSGPKSPMKALHSAPFTLLKARCKDNITIYSAPYSEHSSFHELVEFLHTMKPQRVVPTVNTSFDAVKKQLDILKEYSTNVYCSNESSVDEISAANLLHIAHKRKINSEFF
jgi:DNA cross-link repair 1A protein